MLLVTSEIEYGHLDSLLLSLYSFSVYELLLSCALRNSLNFFYAEERG